VLFRIDPLSELPLFEQLAPVRRDAVVGRLRSGDRVSGGAGGGGRLGVNLPRVPQSAPMPPRQVGAVSLPAQPTVLIGRQRELARIRELLLSSRVRLLTLVGPGGTGKTHLVIAAASALANAFPSGVIFVDLTTAPAAPDVVPTIARALGLRDVGSRMRVDPLARHLSTRELLLEIFANQGDHRGAAVTEEPITTIKVKLDDTRRRMGRPTRPQP
jgi:hypothetical protein